MPTYDYKCKQCGREFEVYLRHIGDPTGGCIDCGSGEIEQVLRSVRFSYEREFVRPYDLLNKPVPGERISVPVKKSKWWRK